MWPFGRRGGRAAGANVKGRAAPAASTARSGTTGTGTGTGTGSQHDVAAVTGTASTANTPAIALARTPSRRSGRRKRTSSRSTTALRDMAKKGPPDPLFEQAPAAHCRSPSSSVEEEITALPVSKRLEQSPHLRPISDAHANAIAYNFQPDGLAHSRFAPSPDRDRNRDNNNNNNTTTTTTTTARKLQRPYSLRKPPPAADTTFLGHRPTKRRAHDSVREEEIRAMSLPLPQKRPAANSGILRRDSKKVKGALNRHFERPVSNVSLPLQDSIHSSMSSSSETRAWRVSALDMFSPRPKIRCSVGSQPQPQSYYGAPARTHPPPGQDKPNTHKEQRTSPPRGRDRKNSRIDDLADTLDAGALREILERDKRRKDKKQRADDDRLRRKLERRAEKQRAAEQGSLPASPRREVVGLGIEEDTATPMEDVRPSTPPRPQMQHSPRLEMEMEVETTPPPQNADENNQLPTPMESPAEEAVIADARAVRYSRASMPSSPQTHTRGPSNVSDLPALLSEMVERERERERELPVETVESVRDPNASGSLYPVVSGDTTVPSRRGSRRRPSSVGSRIAAFASFFRRRKNRSREPGQTTPSEVSFSTTSRESMFRQPLPAHLVAAVPPPTQPVQIRRPSSVPRRTMSKFREDLPEFPMSPPDSRVQSPDVLSPGAKAARRRSRRPSPPPSDLHGSLNSSGPDARTDSPVSPGAPTAGLMSQSLASVDSEGSWLSGKPLKRRSNKSQLRSSIGSSSALNKRNEEYTNSYEELGIPDDEYFRRLNPQPDDRRSSAHSGNLLGTKASSTAMAAADAPAIETPAVEKDAFLDDELLETPADEQPVQTIARHPTVVHRQPRVKSTEGLLSYFHADNPSPEDEMVSDTPNDEVGGHDEVGGQDSRTLESEHLVTVQRAKSVDLGKHHSRQVSAGSAKLLDIPARKSPADPKLSSLSSTHTLTPQ